MAAGELLCERICTVLGNQPRSTVAQIHAFMDGDVSVRAVRYAIVMLRANKRVACGRRKGEGRGRRYWLLPVPVGGGAANADD